MNPLRSLLAKLRERAPALHGRNEHPLPDPSAVRNRAGDVVELAGLSGDAATLDIDAAKGQGRR